MNNRSALSARGIAFFGKVQTFPGIYYNWAEKYYINSIPWISRQYAYLLCVYFVRARVVTVQNRLVACSQWWKEILSVIDRILEKKISPKSFVF